MTNGDISDFQGFVKSILGDSPSQADAELALIAVGGPVAKRILPVNRLKGDFRENEHPRDEGGKFSDKPANKLTGGSESKPSITFNDTATSLMDENLGPKAVATVKQGVNQALSDPKINAFLRHAGIIQDGKINVRIAHGSDPELERRGIIGGEGGFADDQNITLLANLHDDANRVAHTLVHEAAHYWARKFSREDDNVMWAGIKDLTRLSPDDKAAWRYVADSGSEEPFVEAIAQLLNPHERAFGRKAELFFQNFPNSINIARQKLQEYGLLPTKSLLGQIRKEFKPTQPNVDPEALAEVDFVNLPKDIPGTSCGNCVFEKGATCFFPTIRGQKVTEHDCCAAWDHPDAKRPWEKDTDKIGLRAWLARKRLGIPVTKQFTKERPGGNQPVIDLDFDGTIAEGAEGTNGLEDAELRDKAKENITRIHEAGIRIRLWTAHHEPDEVAAWLKVQGIPIDEIEAKKPADAYLDDKAINTADRDWDEIGLETLIQVRGKARQPVSKEDAYDELRELSERGMPEFRDMLGHIDAPIYEVTKMDLGEMEAKLSDAEAGPIVLIGPIKEYQRASEKVYNDYGGNWTKLLDMVRASVCCNSMEELNHAIATVRKAHAVYARFPKDRFREPLSNGYRDILINYRLPCNLITEVQYHLKPMVIARERTRLSYDVVRAIKASMEEEHLHSFKVPEDDIKRFKAAVDKNNCHIRKK
jgi:hypothetical protein